MMYTPKPPWIRLTLHLVFKVSCSDYEVFLLVDIEFIKFAQVLQPSLPTSEDLNKGRSLPLVNLEAVARSTTSAQTSLSVCRKACSPNETLACRSGQLPESLTWQLVLHKPFLHQPIRLAFSIFWYVVAPLQAAGLLSRISRSHIPLLVKGQLFRRRKFQRLQGKLFTM